MIVQEPSQYLTSAWSPQQNFSHVLTGLEYCRKKYIKFGNVSVRDFFLEIPCVSAQKFLSQSLF